MRRTSFALSLPISLAVSCGLAWCTTVHAQESWDATYLGGAKIGYTHTYVEKVKDRGKDYLRVRIDLELKLKRDKDTTVTKIQYGTIETLDGQVLRLDTRTQVGEDNDLRAHGDVIRGEMLLKLVGNGEHQELRIPWGPDVRGPYAPEQSMARVPMKEHEKRELKMFIPDLNKIADITLSGISLEPAILGDGSTRTLLRVEQTTRVDGKPRPEFNNIMWVDPSGQVLKAEQDALGKLLTFRTTREGALSPAGPIKFDLIAGTVIKAKRVIPNSDQTRYIKYRLTLTGGEIKDAIPSDQRQTLEPEGNEGSAVLEIHSRANGWTEFFGRRRSAVFEAKRLDNQSGFHRPRTGQASHPGDIRPLGESPAHQSPGVHADQNQEFWSRFRRGQ